MPPTQTRAQLSDPITLARFAAEATNGKWVCPPHIARMNEYLMELMYGDIDRLMILCPPRHGKCLPAGTPVLMADGMYKPIESVEPGDRVVSMDVDLFETTKSVVSGVMDNGVRSLLKISLWSGRTLECTSNHPLMTYGGWTQAGELRVGDEVVVLESEDGELSWGDIAKIEQWEEAQTYDIEVSGTHNFVANGIIVHNSETCSHFFPPFYLGCKPDHRVILTAYDQDFATKWGRLAKECFAEHGPRIFGQTVNPDKEANSEWETLGGYGGGMTSTGAGAGMTGRGANCLTGETPIETESGPIPIRGLVKMSARPKVRAFNHETGGFEYREIVATMESHSTDIRQIFTESGRNFRCTGNHEIYVPYIGYGAAAFLEKGTNLKCILTYGLDHPEIEYDRIKCNTSVPRPGETVYDIQVEGLNNFFACGVLVHNCLIIDDPIKNPEEAFSDAHRQRLWDWYISVCTYRMEPRGKILMLYTPWHEDDLGQRILRMAADGEMEPWTVLRMPAIAETQEERDEYAEEFKLPLGQPDPIGRAPGEALWPARYPIKALRMKQLPDPEHFEALFQGRPKRRSGSFFQAAWWLDKERGIDHYVNAVPEDMGRIERCRYWDRAGSHRKGDYTAGVLIARVGVTYYIEDVVEGQWAAGERDAVIRTVAAADAKRSGNLIIRGEQEPGSSGQDAALAFVTMLAGYDVQCKIVSGDKEARARTLASQSQVGNVKIVRAGWNKRLISQFTSFPKGKNDDIVDAASGAFNALANVVHTVFRKRSPTANWQGLVTK